MKELMLVFGGFVIFAIGSICGNIQYKNLIKRCAKKKEDIIIDNQSYTIIEGEQL